MKRHGKRLFDWCPQPQTPRYGVLSQYFKPIIALLTVSIIAASILAASLAFSQSIATTPLVVKPTLPQTSTTTPIPTATPTSRSNPNVIQPSTASQTPTPTPILSATPTPIQNQSQSGTNVGGLISQNTTWSKENSPYNFNRDLTVNNGVTLTIESGVTVNMGSSTLKIDGTLNARGTLTAKINFIGNFGMITFTQLSASWNEQRGIGSIIKNCDLSQVRVYTNFASPKISESVFHGQVNAAQLNILGGAPIISNNTFTDNYIRIRGMVLYGDGIAISEGTNAVITNNKIEQNLHGIYLYSRVPSNFTAVIKNNLIINNSWAGIELNSIMPVVIQNNTLTLNANGIEIKWDTANVILKYNNFYNNHNYAQWPGTNDSINIGLSTDPYDDNTQYVRYWLPFNVTATYNWWGTTDTQAINQTFSIKDMRTYGPDLGIVTYIPFLSAPNPQAMPNMTIEGTKNEATD